jgi:CysZ protein
MLDAAIKAISQMFSPAFRIVLLKAAGLALALIIMVAVGLHRLLAWLVAAGGLMLETSIGPNAHGPIDVLEWMIAVMMALGLIAAGVFLMPAATSLVAGVFADEIADLVERRYYPADPPGTAVPIARAIIEGLAAAALAVAVYLVALASLLIAGLGVMIFFLANSFLLGRVYFDLAAMRFHPVAQAKHLRRMNPMTVFVAGMFIALFVSIPIVNLATPLFGTAFMVHIHKRLIGARAAN